MTPTHKKCVSSVRSRHLHSKTFHKESRRYSVTQIKQCWLINSGPTLLIWCVNSEFLFWPGNDFVFTFFFMLCCISIRTYKSIFSINLNKYSGTSNQFHFFFLNSEGCTSYKMGYGNCVLVDIWGMLLSGSRDQLWGSFVHRALCPSQMKISLPRHDLLGEEKWQISQRRRTRKLFLNRLLLGLICIGIRVYK